MSPVMTSRLGRPLDLAWESMYSFCVRELEKAVICELGKTSARYSDNDPQPQLHIVSAALQVVSKVGHTQGQKPSSHPSTQHAPHTTPASPSPPVQAFRCP